MAQGRDCWMCVEGAAIWGGYWPVKMMRLLDAVQQADQATWWINEVTANEEIGAC